jgi:hypothetical protein
VTCGTPCARATGSVSEVEIGNEGHFTLEDKTVFRTSISSHCSGLSERSHVALPAHALQAVIGRLKSVSKEGHFIVEAETVFRPYLMSHCSGVTETRHVALPGHALQAVQVRFKSVGNEGHFTPEAETIFCPYRIAAGLVKYHTRHSKLVRCKQCCLGPNGLLMKGTLLFRPKKFFARLHSNCSGMTETSHMALPSHALQAVQVVFKSVSDEGHFTLEAETVFRPCLAWHCSRVPVTSRVVLPAHWLLTVQV